MKTRRTVTKNVRYKNISNRFFNLSEKLNMTRLNRIWPSLDNLLDEQENPKCLDGISQ